MLDAESGNPQSVSEDVGKQVCLPAQIEQRRIRDSGTLSLMLRSQHDNLFRGRDRQWAEEPSIENAEYGGVDANAQGQRDHNNGSDRGCLRHNAETVAYIMEESFHSDLCSELTLYQFRRLRSD